MRIKLLPVIVFITVWFSAFLQAEKPEKSNIPIQEITVQYGDTLWSVANKYLKDPKRWDEILKYNRLNSSDPNVILPGMKLKVPVMLIKEHLRNAELVSMLNDVRYRRTKETLFKKAILHMKLYNDDAVRTFKESQAQIKFYSGELLRVDENSFIIIRPEQKQDEVNLLAGAVRASRARILAADTVVMPKITPKHKNADFKTRLKENKTTLVEVYEGIVDVTARGKTVTLSKGYGTEVPYLKPPSAPKKLPPLPVLLNEILPGTNITAQSRFSQDFLTITLKSPKLSPGSKGKAKVLGQLINKCHLQVASDHAFKDIVLDEINSLEKNLRVDFKKKNIPDGTYFYRIAYMDELGFEGQFTNPKKFSIDRHPPRITIYRPAEGVFINSEFVRVEGKTEPNCLVKIDGHDVPVGKNGLFQISLAPKYKEVVLTITSEDAFGNIATLKRSLIYLPGKEKKETFFSKPANIMVGILSFTVMAGIIALMF